MDPRQAAIIAEYRRQREALLAEYPDLADDEKALADTLEGQSDAPAMVASFIRAARSSEAMSEALGSMISDEQERKARFDARAKRLRQAALAMLQAMGERRLEMPDFTVSLRNGSEKVDIPDEILVPDEFCKFERKVDRAAVKAALQGGLQPNWATLTAGEPGITARFK